MLKAIAAALLIGITTIGATAAEAKVCRNTHGRAFKCHHVVAPRINLNDRHPVKVVRCRGHVGKFNNCRRH